MLTTIPPMFSNSLLTVPKISGKFPLQLGDVVVVSKVKSSIRGAILLEEYTGSLWKRNDSKQITTNNILQWWSTDER
ncbi:hypothetical protein Y032_0575g194 [Ancylostoma ceylanicum]|uniref:Uncharacterized protein n=1 Tax=Ancylostoma ceylanicum TaxID=53326 RepID=A0A016WNM1_9BILA|nr:hypothetical protein Y032_0575g194 [Ancylostoma ceylanicum]